MTLSADRVWERPEMSSLANTKSSLNKTSAAFDGSFRIRAHFCNGDKFPGRLPSIGPGLGAGGAVTTRGKAINGGGVGRVAGGLVVGGGVGLGGENALVVTGGAKNDVLRGVVGGTRLVVGGTRTKKRVIAGGLNGDDVTLV